MALACLLMLFSVGRRAVEAMMAKVLVVRMGFTRIGLGLKICSVVADAGPPGRHGAQLDSTNSSSSSSGGRRRQQRLAAWRRGCNPQHTAACSQQWRV